MNTIQTPPTDDELTELSVHVLMGLADPYHFHSQVLTFKELQELERPVWDRDNESVMDFQRRFRSWKEQVGAKVKVHLAQHLTEKLKKL